MSRGTQRGHLRFIGSTVRCPQAERRFNLGLEHRYGQEFVCPGCNVRIPATAYFQAKGVPGKREFVAATEKQKLPGERVFSISDELAASILMDWSDPVQLRLEERERIGEVTRYDLVVRRL